MRIYLLECIVLVTLFEFRASYCYTYRHDCHYSYVIIVHVSIIDGVQIVSGYIPGYSYNYSTDWRN